MPTRMMVEVLGDAPVVRDLGRVKRNVEDWSSVWPEVAQILVRGVQRQFDSQGTYGSGGWAPLAPSTLMHKRLLGQPSDILRATGRLEDSLTVLDHPEHVQRTTADGMDWGTSVPYAGYHQSGTSRMPRRRPVEPTESDRRDIVRALQKYALSNAPTLTPTPIPAPPSGGSLWQRAKRWLGW